MPAPEGNQYWKEKIATEITLKDKTDAELDAELITADIDSGVLEND